MSSFLQETVAEKVLPWTVVMGAALQEQAQKLFGRFQSEPQCSIVRGPKLVTFEDEQILPTPHFLIDARLEGCEAAFGGTFLLPSLKPEVGPEKYAVIIDESTGIYHVARKGTIVYKDVVNPLVGLEAAAHHCQFNQETGAQVSRVEMPKEFDALSQGSCTNLPTFGFVGAPSPSSGSVGILNSFGHTLTSSQSSPVVSDNANPFLGVIDSAIVAIGRPRQQVTTTLSTQTRKSADSVFFQSLLTKGLGFESGPSFASPFSSSVNSADSLFFQSLLVKDPIIRATSTAAKFSFSSFKSADSLYFESLLTGEPLGHTGTPVTVSATPRVNSADTRFLQSLMTINNQDGTKFGKVTPDLNEVSRNLLMLFKSGHKELENSPTSNIVENTPMAISWLKKHVIPMSEHANPLDLAAPPSVSKSHLLLSELNLDVTPSQAERFLQDADHLQKLYEHIPDSASGCLERKEIRCYQPVAPRQNALSYEDYSLLSSGVTTEDSETPEETQFKQQPIITPPSSTSDCQMFHLLTREPLEEGLWLHLNSAFHAHDVALPSHNNDDEGSMAFSQTFTSNPQVQPFLDTQNASALPVSASSRIVSAKKERSSLRIHIPGAPSEESRSGKELLDKNSKAGVQKATEDIDLDAIFGEISPDWSGDLDLDHQGPGIESSSASAFTTQAGSGNVEIRFPLKFCDRLPTSVIKAIYVEQLRIWNSEGPWIEGMDKTKTYEMAIENLRRERDDVPEDIMFWTQEVSGEVLRLVEEGGNGGSIGYLESQREQLLALATSNVEWHYFNHCLKESPRGEFQETKFDVAEDPKEWILDMLGGDARKYQTLRSANTTASAILEPKSAYDESGELLQNGVAGSKTNGKSRFPTDSKWRSKFKHLFDANNPQGQTGPFLTPSSSIRQAAASPISSLAHLFSANEFVLEVSDIAAKVAAACTDVSGEALLADCANTLSIAAPVTPALLLRLPNRAEVIGDIVSGDPDDSYGAAAPVTPALLLRLPNREDAMTENVEDAISFQTVDYCPAEENHLNFYPTSADISPRFSGATSRSETTTEPTDHEDSDAPITDQFCFTSKLRPHRFFTVESSDVTAYDISLFGPQKAVQEALDAALKDLQDISSDEDEECIETPRDYAGLLAE